MSNFLPIPTAARINQMLRLRASIFQTAFNPTNARTGAKYLKRRLRGPSMLQYYPKAPPSVTQLKRMTDGLLDGLVDEKEEQRVKDVEAKKARGKGTPRKARSAAESRRLARKK
ncbi:mitochondrial ribosomal subunit S27-domain-containing protein [Auriculariales sp. MPI-PUGE-AT-0066]|nr:mitochondrial ribosomal subunit S27-domain-containing protein [Auriculariales sp. MPI-PUGE-AT-0066]